MNAEILRAVEVAGQALAACRAAVQWADATAATVQVREFLSAMAQREAFRARESARWIVSLASHYQATGDVASAEQLRTLIVDTEGAATGAEEAALRVGSIARMARESEARRTAKRESAERIELRRLHTDRIDVIDVYVDLGRDVEILEAWCRETHWPSGRVTGVLLPHLVELTDAERDEVAQRIHIARGWNVKESEVRHG